MKRTALAFCTVLILTACDKPKPPDIIQPQREALEKAKGVEQTLQQDADATRKQIEEAEGR
ncbi:MAG TPA: hypothetical protein VJM53_03520 [Burkholderiales bacterium]|jgi:hypothetical protein|nr:hypothetical protein [Burkholderiales bacterium]